MEHWKLQDFIDPVVDDDTVPTILIASEEQLRQELDRCRQRRPGTVALTSPQGDCLEIGLGGDYGVLQWDTAESNGMTALANRHLTEESVVFIDQGLPSAVAPEYLLAADEVIDAAAYFYTTHDQPPWLSWRTWNSQAHQWEIKPASAPHPQPVSLR